MTIQALLFWFYQILCSYELGSVYLQLCEMLYLVENRNYEKLVDPSIFMDRFSNSKYVMFWLPFVFVFG
jgi:hypothetical protein